MRLQLVVDDGIGGYKKARSRYVIEDEQNARGHQNCEGGQTHAGGDKPTPGAERQAPETHPAGTHIESSSNKVQRTQQLANAEDGDGSRPKNHPRPFAGAADRANRTEGGILRPSAQGWSIAHKER